MPDKITEFISGRCRERATICQKQQRYVCSDKCGGNLFTVRMAGVIQEA